MSATLDLGTRRDTMDGLYRAVRAIGRFGLWFFFKSVDVRHPERVPPAGAVLLCINHPNNFIDSLLVGGAVGRKVHYLATAALFRNPLVGRFLRACGAIPVYRRQDDPDKMDRNLDAFEACFRAFREGRLVAIYPEGTTHAEVRVQRIKTGAARLALGYEAERPRELLVIPVGLNFDARKSFRGRVLVSFGSPVAVTPVPRRLPRRSGQGGRGADRRHPVGHGGRGRPRRAHRRRPPGDRRPGALPRRARARARVRARARRAADRPRSPVAGHRGFDQLLQGPRAGAGRADLAAHPELPGPPRRVSRQGRGGARAARAAAGPDGAFG